MGSEVQNKGVPTLPPATHLAHLQGNRRSQWRRSRCMHSHRHTLHIGNQHSSACGFRKCDIWSFLGKRSNSGRICFVWTKPRSSLFGIRNLCHGYSIPHEPRCKRSSCICWNTRHNVLQRYGFVILTDSESNSYSESIVSAGQNVLWRKVQEGAFSFDNPQSYSTSNSTLPAGWRVCMECTSNQPETTPWYVRGVEVVPAADSCEIGTTIKASLWQMNPGSPKRSRLLNSCPWCRRTYPIESNVHDITPQTLTPSPFPKEHTTAAFAVAPSSYLSHKRYPWNFPVNPTMPAMKWSVPGKCFADKIASGAIGIGGDYLVHLNAFLFTPNTRSPDCGRYQELPPEISLPWFVWLFLEPSRSRT